MKYLSSRRVLVAAAVLFGLFPFSHVQAQDERPSREALSEPSTGPVPNFLLQQMEASSTPATGNVGVLTTPSRLFGVRSRGEVDGDVLYDLGAFDPPVPQSFVEIMSLSPAEYCGAGASMPDGSVYYLICRNILYRIDMETAAVDSVGLLPRIGIGDTYTGMDWDPETETWYAITSLHQPTAPCARLELYVIDVETADGTSVGTNPDIGCPVALAFTPEGEAYTYSVLTDALYRIDKTTADEEYIGPIGFNANYGQGMAYDHLNQRMYMTALDFSVGRSQLRSVDLETGMTTLEWEFLPGQYDAAAGPVDGIVVRPEAPTLRVNTILEVRVVPLRESDTTEVQIQNIGLAPLTIHDISLAGGEAGFALDISETEMTLDTDERTSFLVSFASEEVGELSDVVVIGSNEPGSSRMVPLKALSRNIAFDEPCHIGNFDVAHSDPVVFTCEGGSTEGAVQGFHFVGTVSGINGTANWASDLCMRVEAPDGTSFTVGGFDVWPSLECYWYGTHAGNPWDFQGPVSTFDGTYESTHDYVFPFVEDEGTWTFTFANDLFIPGGNPTMHWSDVTVTLRKVGGGATETKPSSPEPENALSMPNPNPVWESASLVLQVAKAQDVVVEVFDVTGRRVQMLYDAALAAGTAERLTLDASALPAGVYMVRARGEDFAETQRVTIAR